MSTITLYSFRYESTEAVITPCVNKCEQSTCVLFGYESIEPVNNLLQINVGNQPDIYSFTYNNIEPVNIPCAN